MKKKLSILKSDKKITRPVSCRYSIINFRDETNR